MMLWLLGVEVEDLEAELEEVHSEVHQEVLQEHKHMPEVVVEEP